MYPEEAVQRALAKCHEEVFERILETPLAELSEDVRECLETMPGGMAITASHWQRMEAYRVLLPEESPDYLKELFCSNLRALLEILRSESSTARASE